LSHQDVTTNPKKSLVDEHLAWGSL
jgi:hypothetical protein